MIRLIKNTGLVALAIMVTGCATRGDYARVPVEEAGSQPGSVYESSGYPSKSDPDYSDPQFEIPNSAPSAAPNNSAVIALLSSGQQQRKSGDYQRAAATLERAIRISPRNPELYYELAQVRYLEGNYHQGEQLCRKAISLAAGDRVLIERCRSLIRGSG